MLKCEEMTSLQKVEKTKSVVTSETRAEVSDWCVSGVGVFVGYSRCNGAWITSPSRTCTHECNILITTTSANQSTFSTSFGRFCSSCFFCVHSERTNGAQERSMSAYENRTCSVRGDMHDVSPLVKAVLGIMFQLPKEVRDGVLKEVSTWMVEEQDVVVPSLGWPALLVLGMSVLLTLSVVKEIWAQQQQFQKIQRSDYCKAPASFTMYMWYRFGYWFSWTSGASTIVLGALSLSLLVSGCIVQTILTGCDVNGALWSAWIYTAAPNGGSSGTTVGERIVGAVVSVGGMLIAASLMSVVSSSFEDMLEGFREGRAPVAEGKHIVILGQ